MPTLLEAWDSAQSDYKQSLLDLIQGGTQPPKAAAELLKTKALRENLALIDQAKTDGDVDAARKAASKVQKFFLQYAGKFKVAMDETRTDELDSVHEALKMFNVFMTRTQVGAAQTAKAILTDAKANSTDDDEKRELDIKNALTPLRFKYDWKAAKEEFEKATGKKKPSEKILGSFRKTAGLDNALDELDKACKEAKPSAYRKAYKAFLKQSADYLKVLNAALASDKAADEVYEKKTSGLKDMLSSLKTRAQEKIRLLDELGV